MKKLILFCLMFCFCEKWETLSINNINNPQYLLIRTRIIETYIKKEVSYCYFCNEKNDFIIEHGINRDNVYNYIPWEHNCKDYQRKDSVPFERWRVTDIIPFQSEHELKLWIHYNPLGIKDYIVIKLSGLNVLKPQIKTDTLAIRESIELVR